MTANLLTLNSSKTEFLLIGLKNQLAKIHNSSLDTSHSARNLGFIFDEHLTFCDQITALSKACYYHIRQLRCIRPYPDWSTACTIATSIVHSRLDYCNSLYCKLPNLNYPVSSRSRTLLLVGYCHESTQVLLYHSHPTLSSLAQYHWTHRIQAPFTYLYKVLTTIQPPYTFITSSPFNVLAVLALYPSLVLLGHLHHPL